MPIDSIPARLFKRAETMSHQPAYYQKQGDHWQPTTWKTYAAQVAAAARSMIALGFEPNDSVCILGFNTPQWVIFDLAAMAAGGVAAGIYTTCSPEEVQYIVDHSEAKLVLLEDKEQWEKVLAELEKMPKLKHVVMMPGAERIDHDMVMTWDEFVAAGEQVEQSALDARLDGITDEQVCTYIYTSGTTGPPKAVMLSHKNLSWTATKAIDLANASSSDSSVSYLPLSHIAEQVFSIHGPITGGWSIYFAESIEKLPDNLKEVQPTIVFGVPRIWEKMHAKVSDQLSQATGLKLKIAQFAQRTGLAVTESRNRGHEPKGLLKLRYALAKKLVFSKAKPKMGLGNARVCVTGAAPLSREVIEFFASLDLCIHEVYGQSEDCGPTTFNLIGHTRFGTVGTVVEGTEVKIAEDGEILVRGPHVFQGYFKDEAATNDTLIDGWLHSGDLGAFTEEGFLKITGRKKEIIITAGGKNIAPKNIEAAIKNSPLVSQAVVIGDRRKFLSALITLEPEAAAAWAAAKGVDAAGVHQNAGLTEEIQTWVDQKVNAMFARVEHVRKFTILPEDFSIEKGELTPTMKIKRRIIYANYDDVIEGMYQG